METDLCYKILVGRATQMSPVGCDVDLDVLTARALVERVGLAAEKDWKGWQVVCLSQL